jgi:hypothetical protein
MMKQYKLLLDRDTKQATSVILTTDDFTLGIPFDPANTDYQEYLKWVAEGNQPLPADE